MKRFFLMLPVMVMQSAAVSEAQNVSSSGQNWSGSWGFSSATDRSIGLQQAQVLRQAEARNADPTTSYNNYYDSRTNYVESNAGGDVTTDFQIGDVIGKNTYSVGSLNTGNTTVDIVGDGNIVDAVNSADTQGCVNGSINTLSSTSAEPIPYLPVVRSCE